MSDEVFGKKFYAISRHHPSMCLQFVMEVSRMYWTIFLYQQRADGSCVLFSNKYEVHRIQSRWCVAFKFAYDIQNIYGIQPKYKHKLSNWGIESKNAFERIGFVWNLPSKFVVSIAEVIGGRPKRWKITAAFVCAYFFFIAINSFELLHKICYLKHVIQWWNQKNW